MSIASQSAPKCGFARSPAIPVDSVATPHTIGFHEDRQAELAPLMESLVAAEREGFYSATTRAVHLPGSSPNICGAAVRVGGRERRVAVGEWRTNTPRSDRGGCRLAHRTRGGARLFVGPNGAGTSITWPKVEPAYALETRQLLNATIRGREIWSPTQQCGGVSEPAADVDVRKSYLTNHFGRHSPPLGDFLLLPTRADRTFGWPSPTNELF
jgi:hypothetical protein